MRIGLWIDRRKAVVVFLHNGREQRHIIQSNLERHVRAGGGWGSSTPYGVQDVAAEDKRERKFLHHFKDYLETVAEFIRDGETYYIFGPGDAKLELKKHLDHKQLGDRVAAIDTTDKMTTPQMAAKVRKFYEDLDKSAKG